MRGLNNRCLLGDAGNGMLGMGCWEWDELGYVEEEEEGSRLDIIEILTKAEMRGLKGRCLAWGC